MTKQQRNKAIQGNLKHVKKPDVDNLIKLYLDVVSGIAIEDDNCVSLGQAVKVYSSKPRVEIYIEDADELITMDEIWEGTWPTMQYNQS